MKGRVGHKKGTKPLLWLTVGSGREVKKTGENRKCSISTIWITGDRYEGRKTNGGEYEENRPFFPRDFGIQRREAEKVSTEEAKNPRPLNSFEVLLACYPSASVSSSFRTPLKAAEQD